MWCWAGKAAWAEEGASGGETETRSPPIILTDGISLLARLEGRLRPSPVPFCGASFEASGQHPPYLQTPSLAYPLGTRPPALKFLLAFESALASSSFERGPLIWPAAATGSLPPVMR